VSMIQTLKGKDRDFDETTLLKLQTALGVAALDGCSSAATELWPCLVNFSMREWCFAGTIWFVGVEIFPHE